MIATWNCFARRIPRAVLMAIAVALAVASPTAHAAIRITGLSPVSGPVGTVVTLTGEGFSPVANSNIVRISGMRAAVTAATETSLTVTVPAGATHGSFRVTANGLSAESRLGFVVTFPMRALNASAFHPPDIFSPGTYPTPSAVADLDGDGRPDLLVANHFTIGIYRNDGTGSVAGLFSLVTNLPAAEIPNEIQLSDIDGDGKLDIFVVNYSENAVAVYRNISTAGQIQFAPRMNFPVNDAPIHGAVADLDGDGRPDLLTTSYSQGSISVLRNTSDTNGISFAPRVDFPTMPGPHNVAVKDLDGDGKPDVVVIHHTPSSPAVVVLRNVSETGIINSNSLQITARLAANGTYVAFGDLDSDGRPDIVTCSAYSQSVTIFQNLSATGNLGTNAFGPPVTLAAAGRAKSLVVTDLDGDGRLDLAFASESSDALGIYRNLGGTNGISASWFAPRLDLAAGWNADGLSISDIDLDGLPDIVFCSIYANQVWIYRAVAPATPATFHIAGFGPASGPVGTTVTLTGKGFSPVAGNNVVFIGGLRATVTGATATSLTFTVPVGATYGPITVTANGRTTQSPLAFDVTFPTRILDSSAFDAALKFSPGDGPIATRLGDLDGDGRPELAVANYYANTLSIYRNSNTGGVAGVFAPKIDFPTGVNPFDLHLADMDGDGKLDVVVINYGEDTVSVFRNTSTPGQISFAARMNFSTGNGQHHNANGAVGDLDGDGRPDIIATSYDQGSIAVLRNTSGAGGLSFAAHVDFQTMSGAHGVGIQDLDGDGKPDVVVIHHLPTSLAVVVLRNVSEPGTFNTSSLQPVAQLGANGNYVTFGDFDGDGRADIVTCSWYGHSVTLFQNLSNGDGLSAASFGPPVTLPSAGSTKRIAVSDLDGDGRPDLAFPTELGDSLGIYRNVGGSNGLSASWFAPRVDLASGWNGDGISIGDIDLDGYPDIVFCSFYIDEVWIYRGLVLTAPAITAQLTNLTVGLGGNASLTVQATGGGLHYSWYHDGLLVPGATANTLPISNAHGVNAGQYFVVVQNSGGSVTSAVVTVTVLVERTLALSPVADVDEGGLIATTLTLTSSGDVGGIDFVINYSGTYLAEPVITWDSSLDGALKQSSVTARGQFRGVIVLPATALPAGTQALATIQFRARTIITTNVQTAIGLLVSDLSDPLGNPIVGGTEVIGTSVNIHDTGFLAGDNNANHQLDIGDAALLMRLLAQLDLVRSWDTTANDFNANKRLDSGDVIKMLRAIAGLEAPPQIPPPVGGIQNYRAAFGSAGLAPISEAASLSPALLTGSAGQFVTLQVRLDSLRTPISGASFTLNYPVAALRLLNAQSHRAGPAVPVGALAVWNISPAQTNYATQDGHITLALGNTATWAASNTVLAEFTFQVQPGATNQYLWPFTISALEITGDGYNNRTLGALTAAFVGRSPVSGTMTRLSVALGGPVTFNFSGDTGANYRIDFSDDLIHWSLLREVLNHSGPIQITDPAAGLRPHRFYRCMPLP